MCQVDLNLALQACTWYVTVKEGFGETNLRASEPLYHLLWLDLMTADSPIACIAINVRTNLAQPHTCVGESDRRSRTPAICGVVLSPLPHKGRLFFASGVLCRYLGLFL